MKLTLPRVRISRQALALANRHAIEAGSKEVGGILVGWWEGAGTAVVHDLLIVPDVDAGWNHYKRKQPVAQETLNAYLVGLGDQRVGYVGEWHSHPAPQQPSGTDRAVLTSIARRTSNTVALVVLAVEHGEVTPHALIGRRGRWPRRRTLQQAVIERMDP
jgi:integrative and conjugative element protein (TIGR02256 family)